MPIDTPPAIVQIAQRAQSQEKGVVVLYHLHRVFDVQAGPRHRHEDLELAVVSEATHTIKVRVLRSTVDGKASDETATRKIEDQYEHPNPGDVFHRPFDAQYLSEYSYKALDANTYRFTGLVRDSAHGDGTFSLDAAGNVVSYRYTPNALPKYSTSGTVQNDRAQVLPGIWQLTREAHQYSGQYAFVKGGATAVITYDSYVHYPDVASAEAALLK